MGKNGTRRFDSYEEAERALFEEFGRPDEFEVSTKAGDKTIRVDDKGKFYFEDEKGTTHYYDTFTKAKVALYKEYGNPMCFPADTLILMERATKCISDLQVGGKL